MPTISRRAWLLELSLIAFVAGCERKRSDVEGKVDTRKVCDAGGSAPHERSLRLALHYVEQSPDRERRCLKCSQFFRETPDEDCGKCVLVPGGINQNGNCARWSRVTPRPALP
jgi:hypothetical protein